MTDNDDPIGGIPPIVPSRDGLASRQRIGGRKQQESAGPAASGSSLWVRLLLVISLVVAAAACAWAWQLQQQQEATGLDLLHYEERIADLESRLSDTDEGVNQSGAVTAVKIKELYSEVDKLWASAWRTNKAKIADLEKAAATSRDELAKLGKTDSAYSAQLKSLAADMKKFQALAGAADRLQQAVGASEAQREKLGDDLRRMELEFARLQQRVTANEEWVESINSFRKQVNRSLSEINARLGSLQPSAPAG